MLTVSAPAKINLTLEVLSKHSDGFHEVRSVMQTISLFDTFTFQPNDGIEFRSNSPGWSAVKSLIFKAALLLRQSTNCSQGASVGVKKVIPLLSGLGGDSSDAAAVMGGLNQFWGLGLSRERLLELAEELGSDIPFFLYGGTALAENRGEVVTPLPPFPHHWVVLLVPPGPRPQGKTKLLYDSLKDTNYTDGQITHRLAETLREGGEFTHSLLFNTFEQVAPGQFSELEASREQMLKAGAADIHLAGSGPALFTILKEKPQAKEVFNRLQQQKLECYLTETLPVIDQ